MFRKCYRDIHGSFTTHSRLIHGSFTAHSRLIHGSFPVIIIHGLFTGHLRSFALRRRQVIFASRLSERNYHNYHNFPQNRSSVMSRRNYINYNNFCLKKVISVRKKTCMVISVRNPSAEKLKENICSICSLSKRLIIKAMKTGSRWSRCFANFMIIRVF